MEIKTTDFVKKINNYAKTKYRTNSASRRTTRLLCGVSPSRFGAQICSTTEELERDARVLRHNGSPNTERNKGARLREGQQPPLEKTVRQPLALMDELTTAETRYQYPDVQRLPHPLRVHVTITN